MIEKIEIINFKSIFAAKIKTGNLNVFTGVNGSGKSTFLQSLLLLRQSYTADKFFRNPISLKLSNSNALINLGTFKDVLCHNAKKGDENLIITVDFLDKRFKFVSEQYDTETNRDLNVIKGNLVTNLLELEKESLFSTRFQYLGAERIEPTEDYPRFQYDELLGKRGEYTAHFIEKYGNRDIAIKELAFNEKQPSHILIKQLNNWMSTICESIEVNTKENLNTNRIELSYRHTLPDGTPTQNQKPQNIGFGITHTLPIVVAILAAQPNDLIIIENPETHLHPRGQTKLSHLFALAAENNVQIFIETHSDHIINGLRVAVKKGLISEEKIFLHYFSKKPDTNTEIKRIYIQPEGGLDDWPDGFFDEWDKLLNELL